MHNPIYPYVVTWRARPELLAARDAARAQRIRPPRANRDIRIARVFLEDCNGVGTCKDLEKACNRRGLLRGLHGGARQNLLRAVLRQVADHVRAK